MTDRVQAFRTAALMLSGVLTAACLPLMPQAARAQAPAAAAQAPDALDQVVAQALRRMDAALAAAPSVTLRLTQLREAPTRPDGGQVITLGATVAVGIRRPDRLAALVGSDRGSFRLWFDGETATLLNLNANAFARTAVAGGIDGALEALEARLGVDIPLRDLLAQSPFAALTEAGTTGFHVGVTMVNGTACEHYALRNREVDWQIWIAAGAEPLPCRLVVVDRAAPGAPRTILEFQHWNLQAQLDEGTFAFVAPEGATEVSWLERRGTPAR